MFPSIVICTVQISVTYSTNQNLNMHLKNFKQISWI